MLPSLIHYSSPADSDYRGYAKRKRLNTTAPKCRHQLTCPVFSEIRLPKAEIITEVKPTDFEGKFTGVEKIPRFGFAVTSLK
jgi:hypothetical protein